MNIIGQNNGSLLKQKQQNVDDYMGAGSSAKLKGISDPDKMHTALMSDLRVATDKFFIGGQTRDENVNFLPEIKDVTKSS